MAKAKKLPSGSWRTLIYDYTDNTGKRHYKSFTADTKKESEYLASQYALAEKDVANYGELCVQEAISQYISIKSSSLSPTTITGYKSQLKNHYKAISQVKLKDLNSAILQRWVGGLSRRLSPKSVANAHGLLMSVLDMFDINKRFKVTLPQKIVKNDYIPVDEDIKKLIDYYNIHSKDMVVAICLSAFGTLRRSEICALTADDVQGNKIIINKSMIKDVDGKFIIKPTPKNLSSNRIVEYPSFVINILPKQGRLVNLKPSTITVNICKDVKKLGLPHFRFHDLRHYSASIMHAIGVPDVYIMERGGWSSDKTLKKIYRNSLTDYQKKYTQQTNEYFENMQHEMQHEI